MVLRLRSHSYSKRPFVLGFPKNASQANKNTNLEEIKLSDQPASERNYIIISNPDLPDIPGIFPNMAICDGASEIDSLLPTDLPRQK